MGHAEIVLALQHVTNVLLWREPLPAWATTDRMNPALRLAASMLGQRLRPDAITYNASGTRILEGDTQHMFQRCREKNYKFKN